MSARDHAPGSVSPRRDESNGLHPAGPRSMETPVAQLEARLGYGRYAPDGDSVRFVLDGREVEATADETILQAAARHGVAIPHLCYTEGMRPDGNCRACMVEIDGERVLAASCCRRPAPGMQVRTDSDRARHSQRMVVELLLADTVADSQRADSELLEWATQLEVRRARFRMRPQPPPDFSHPGMEVRLAACIQCTRCVRACREVQVNDVIGYAHRGNAAKIVFDFDDPMGESTCVGCGECVQACPTGALVAALPAVVKKMFVVE